MSESQPTPQYDRGDVRYCPECVLHYIGQAQWDRHVDYYHDGADPRNESDSA